MESLSFLDGDHEDAGVAVPTTVTAGADHGVLVIEVRGAVGFQDQLPLVLGLAAEAFAVVVAFPHDPPLSVVVARQRPVGVAHTDPFVQGSGRRALGDDDVREHSGRCCRQRDDWNQHDA
jgi:hypothetical protein